jgi:hypothetical protein
VSILTIRDAVVATISKELPSLKTCEAHPGRFDVAELRRTATRAPAVLVAAMALTDVAEEHGEIKADVTLAVFAVSNAAPGVSRGDGALGLAQALAMIIPGNRWGLDESESIPRAIRAENLYSGELESSGVAIWATTWKQRFSLATLGAELTLDDFITCYITTTLGPDGSPVAEDEVTLPQED